MNKKWSYERFYSIYRKLPIIVALVNLASTIIWSFIDIIIFKIPDNNGIYRYGVMQLPSPFLSVLVWWAIGIIYSIAIWFLLSIAMSATVVRTDAILEMNERDKMDIK